MKSDESAIDGYDLNRAENPASMKATNKGCFLSIHQGVEYLKADPNYVRIH